MGAMLAATPALAVEARVTQLRVEGARIWTTVELRDLLRDNFLALVRQGRAIFVQLQADLWEDRRVFDRLVFTATPATYRVDGDASGTAIIVTDQYGGSAAQSDARAPLTLRIDVGQATRLADDRSYYVHAIVTAATVDERDIDQAGQAIFGEETSTSSLAGLGRFVFRTLLRMGKYLESASAEVTSRRVTGRDVRTGAF
jgi:hypothetical protein